MNDGRMEELKEEMEEQEDLKGGMLAMEEEQVMNLGQETGGGAKDKTQVKQLRMNNCSL